MGEGQQRSARLHGVEAPERPARQPELRGTAVPEHLDVLPEHAPRVTGAERLHGGFLGGEPGGQARDWVAVARTIRNLAVREHAAQKAVAVPLEHVAYARDVRRVEAQPQDAHV